jgi:hypothetical protein
LAITKCDETHLRGGAALEIFLVRKSIGVELEEQSASAAAPIASVERIDFQEKYRQRPAFSLHTFFLAAEKERVGRY